MPIPGSNYDDNSVNPAPRSLIGAASNIITGDNPPFAVADFVAQYPQFGPDAKGKYLVPEIMLTMYVNLAHSYLKQARWKNTWQMAMGLFVAHFATIYLQSAAKPGAEADQVVASGAARGMIASESAGDLSVSYESIASDLDGWAAWKLTIFGQQLVTFAKIIGKGGMYVW